jgi:alcohol dehydrogenase (NADP+)
VTTKVWNTNHRPERVRPAFDGSLERLGLDYLDLYLIHTPFAFKPGDDQDPRDEKGDVIHDKETALVDTWRAMQELVGGRCRAIGLSDFDLGKLKPVYAAARIKPAVIQVEAHPYLPETELLKKQASCSWRLRRWATGCGPGPIEHPVVLSIAEKNPGAGLVGVGGTARDRIAYDAEEPRAGDREFRRLPSFRRRHERNRFDRDKAKVQPRR